MAKVITPAQAAELIKDNDSVAPRPSDWPDGPKRCLAVETLYQSGHPKKPSLTSRRRNRRLTGRGESTGPRRASDKIIARTRIIPHVLNA
jgi:hypothetical protein